MSWYKRLGAAPDPDREQQRPESPAGPVGSSARTAVPRLYRSELERNLNVCPKCGAPYARVGPGTSGDVPGRAAPGRTDRRARAPRFSEVPRQQTLPGSHRPGTESHEGKGRPGGHAGTTARHAVGLRGVRVRVHGWLHGLGRRREIRAGGRRLPEGTNAAGVLLHQRGRAHAGRRWCRLFQMSQDPPPRWPGCGKNPPALHLGC